MNTINHGDTTCPVWNEDVLPNEDGNCSLCDEAMDAPIAEIIRRREEQAFLNGHASAVHHVNLYGDGHLLKVQS